MSEPIEKSIINYIWQQATPTCYKPGDVFVARILPWGKKNKQFPADMKTKPILYRTQNQQFQPGLNPACHRTTQVPKPLGPTNSMTHWIWERRKPQQSFSTPWVKERRQGAKQTTQFLFSMSGNSDLVRNLSPLQQGTHWVRTFGGQASGDPWNLLDRTWRMPWEAGGELDFSENLPPFAGFLFVLQHLQAGFLPESS